MTIATQGVVSTMVDSQARIASSVDDLEENIRNDLERLNLGISSLSDAFEGERQGLARNEYMWSEYMANKHGKAALRAAIITWIAPSDAVDRVHDAVNE